MTQSIYENWGINTPPPVTRPVVPAVPAAPVTPAFQNTNYTPPVSNGGAYNATLYANQAGTLNGDAKAYKDAMYIMQNPDKFTPGERIDARSRIMNSEEAYTKKGLMNEQNKYTGATRLNTLGEAMEIGGAIANTAIAAGGLAMSIKNANATITHDNNNMELARANQDMQINKALNNAARARLVTKLGFGNGGTAEGLARAADKEMEANDKKYIHRARLQRVSRI